MSYSQGSGQKVVQMMMDIRAVLVKYLRVTVLIATGSSTYFIKNLVTTSGHCEMLCEGALFPI